MLAPRPGPFGPCGKRAGRTAVLVIGMGVAAVLVTVPVDGGLGPTLTEARVAHPSTSDRGPCPAIPRAGTPGVFDCVSLAEPRDYEHPRGPAVRLALEQHRAAGLDHRIGSIFIDPGGPGTSGLALATWADYAQAPEDLARLDLVRLAPRAVTRSDPPVCLRRPGRAERVRSLPAFPVTAREARTTARAHALVGRFCARGVEALLADLRRRSETRAGR